MRVVEIATSQDVGRILNPVQARGQIEGGVAQGLGLALLEELVLVDGKIANANFTDYLLPTAMDTPPIEIAAFIEQPEPGAPFGLKVLASRLSSRPLQLLSPQFEMLLDLNSIGCPLNQRI